MPPGLSFNTTTGIFSGIPTTAGSYPSIVVSGTNSTGTVALPAITWTIFDVGNMFFPTSVPGQTLSINRKPVWKTNVQSALSAKETAVIYQQYPIYEWAFQYELVRDDQATSDLRTLVGFFNSAFGRGGTFLYLDPTFSAVTAEPFGTGDGTKKAFQLTATFKNAGGAGAPEIVQNLNGAPAVFDNGSLVSTSLYTLGPTGIVTLNTALAAGHALTWTGGFYYRVRFTDDSLDFQQFLNKWWQLQTLSFRSVVL